MKKNNFFVSIALILMVFIFPGVSNAAEIQAQYYIMDHSKDTWGILSLYASDNDVTSYSFEGMGASNQTYDHAMHMMAEKAAGRDISGYVQSIKKAQLKNGKFADTIDSGGEKLVKAHIWSIISLYCAWDNGYDKSAALRWLKSKQNQDGGFPAYAGGKSDIKTTAQAVLAFKCLGMESEQSTQRAAVFLDSNVKSEKNVENLSWVLMAKSNLGNKDKQLYDRIKTFKTEDGSYSASSSSKTPDYMTTCIVVAAMTDYEKEYSLFKRLHNADMFKDVKRGYPEYPAVMEIVNRDIAAGYPDSTFRPQNNVTRAEFSKFLIYALRLESQIAKQKSPFNDMKEHWSDSTVALAYSKKLVSGIGDGKFAPDQKVTGAQIAAMLVRAKGLEGIAARFPGKTWYDGYVSAAKRRGLLYEGFEPDAYATRAQCAQAISRIY